MKLIRSVSYSFIHHGQEFGSVCPTRGIRQGDPISPYIYIMCAEGLSAMIRRNENAGLIHGCTIARGAPTISHLLFADDCYFFFRAVETEANVMKRILNRYEEMSGQVVNFDKSTVVFSPNTKGEDREKVCAQLGVREINIPGNYLGMPMIVGRRKVSTFKVLVGKVEKKLQAWGSRVISMAGKVMLLKTAAQTIPNFWMSLFLIPKDIIDMIEKRMNAFWWCSNGGTGGIKWMAWERLCEVNEEGGLGLKKLHEFNIAMLAKQAWRIINNANPLVTQLLKARYYPTTDFLNALPRANQSYVWRSILETQAVVKQRCRRRIGDGKDTRVWQVPWLPDKQNGYLTSAIYPDLDHMTVDGLISMDGREWDRDIINELCNERDTSLILQGPIPMRIRADSWFWIHEEKGDFSVCSCYRLLRGESVGHDRHFWKRLWGLNVPGKVANFLWRTARGVLPTAADLLRKHVEIQPNCTWCHIFTEDAAHVLFGCSFARELWEAVGLSHLVYTGDVETGVDIMKRVVNTATKDQCVMFSLLCWGLWVRRNKWVWEKVCMSSFGVKHMALNLLSEWNRAQEIKKKHQNNCMAQQKKWSKPPEGWIKINIDASCSTGWDSVGVGCVVRDDRGSFQRARSNQIEGKRTPREAEALSMQKHCHGSMVGELANASLRRILNCW